MPGAAQAADWRITPRLTLQESYTDNVGLAPSGEERSSRIHEIRPGVSVRGTGRRLQVSLDFAYQYLDYTRDEFDSEGFPRLGANANLEVIEDFFFLDASASATQRNTTTVGRRAVDTLSRSGNTETVYTYQVTPSVRHRFGSYAEGRATLTSSDLRNDSVQGATDSSDSTSREFSASLTSGREFALTPWSLGYSQRNIDFEDEQEDTEFRSINGTISYRANRQLTPFVSLGYSDNEFQTRDEDRESGVTWRTGLTWTPSVRTTVTAGYGEQVFGESFSLDVNHRRRRSVFSASYSESLTTQRDLLLDRVVVPVEDPFGNPIEDPLTGEPLLIPLDILRETNETFVNRAFRASYALQGRRSTFQVGVNQSRRSFELSGDSDRTVGLDASLSRSLSRDADATLSGRWQRSEDEQTGIEDTIWDIRLRYTYRVAESLSTNVTVAHVESDAEDEENSYEENRITAGLTVTF